MDVRLIRLCAVHGCLGDAIGFAVYAQQRGGEQILVDVPVCAGHRHLFQSPPNDQMLRQRGNYVDEFPPSVIARSV